MTTKADSPQDVQPEGTRSPSGEGERPLTRNERVRVAAAAVLSFVFLTSVLVAAGISLATPQDQAVAERGSQIADGKWEGYAQWSTGEMSNLWFRVINGRVRVLTMYAGPRGCTESGPVTMLLHTKDQYLSSRSTDPSPWTLAAKSTEPGVIEGTLEPKAPCSVTGALVVWQSPR